MRGDPDTLPRIDDRHVTEVDEVRSHHHPSCPIHRTDNLGVAPE